MKKLGSLLKKNRPKNRTRISPSLRGFAGIMCHVQARNYLAYLANQNRSTLIRTLDAVLFLVATKKERKRFRIKLAPIKRQKYYSAKRTAYLHS